MPATASATDSAATPVFTQAFRDELDRRFGLDERFVRAFLEGRAPTAPVVDRWEDLINPNQALSSAYIHFALSNVVRGRQARDLIMRLTGIRSGRSLDVGSAYGGMVVAFAEQGFTAKGVEIDPHWCRLGNINCSSRGLGELITREDFLTASPGEGFDVISCNDVIEHLVEPRFALERMAGMLAPGGVLYLVIPNARSWDHVIRDGHYGEFGLNLLDHHAARAYYDLRAKGRFGKDYSCGEFYPLDWYLRTLGYQGLSCRVHRPSQASLPDAAALAAIVDKLEAAFRGWVPDGLPELLADRLVLEFRDYMAGLRSDHAHAAAAPSEFRTQDFAERYLDPFWTVIARRQPGGAEAAGG